MFKNSFKVGDIFTNKDMCNEFRCGNMGRIRVSNITNTLVLLTYEHKGCYIDEVKDEITYYTGQGKISDQTLDKRNEKLYNYKKYDLSIHLFRVTKANNYIYEGEMEILGTPYIDVQKDDLNALRNVYIFPLKRKG